MHCSTAAQNISRAPLAAASPAAAAGRRQRQRRPLVTTAAVQPDKKEKSVKIDVFETMGAPPTPASSGPEAEGGLLASWLSSIDTSEPGSFDGEEKTDYDPLRDGPLRYLGYANECGEAFAAWLFPGGVTLRWARGVTCERGAAALPVALVTAECLLLTLCRPCTAPLCCSYAIAIGYVLFDTYDKWQKTLGDARLKLTTRPMPASVDLER